MNKMKLIFYTIALVSCLAFTTFGQKSIRNIDFNNFTYDVPCGTSQSISFTVKNGIYSVSLLDHTTRNNTFKILGVGFGDVNSDGRLDGIVFASCHLGISKTPIQYRTEGFVYTLKNNKPFLLSRLEGDNNSFNTVKNISMENGILTIVRRSDYQKSERNVLPNDDYFRVSYKWDGVKMRRISAERMKQ